MNEDKFQGKTPEELDQLVEQVYAEYKWVGKSCLSYFWPYTRGPEMFEVRRAIANSTNGLRSTYGPLSLSLSTDQWAKPELSDLLAFIKAANTIYNAADTALHEVVAEARSRGATWQQVGDILGITRKGAHNRFGKGLSSDRQDELLVERVMSDTIFALWNELASMEHLGFDDEFWTTVSNEVAVSFAIRRFMHSTILFTKSFASLADEKDNQSDEDSAQKLLEDLERAYIVLQHSYHILQTPQALRTIVSYSKQLSSDHPWTDTNANMYFIQAISCMAYAFNHFTKMWGHVADARALFRQIAFVKDCMTSAVAAFARPECLHVLALIDANIHEVGDEVPVKKRSDENGETIDPMEIITTYWKQDKHKAAEFLGVDEVGDTPSLEELLKLLTNAPGDSGGAPQPRF